MTPTLETSLPLVVGVGASSGGLEAFQEMLLPLGDATDLAIVFLQHLERDGGDLLIELLSKSTSMPVISVTGRKKLKPGSIYVCPPWTLLELTNGSLRIAKTDNEKRPEAPIDHFLQSLAENQRERGIGVILSGTGSDGTLGLKAISDAGGLTFAQSAESAKYDSMPRSAATTGVADHVLSASAIAVELKKYASYLAKISNAIVEPSSVKQIHDAIPAISKRLMELTNHNFQHYKQNTLARRIRRRMQLLKISSVDNYVKRLMDDDEEPQALFRELLISVTQFFRDPEAFELLASTVIPKLFEGRKPEDAVRIWVPGCATGEEAYSIAMLCCEHLDQIESPPEVQIFATDIDDRALKICRQGNYSIGIEADVSAERLKRFFIKRGKKFQVTQEIRELVLFSAHNLISDPPFSRLDLISCRNLLIYLGPHLQMKLIPLFHCALRPAGFLLLGPSENISSHGELFRIVDAKHRLSQRKGTGVDATAALSIEEGGNNAGESNPPPAAATQSTDDLLQLMQRIVLDEFAPKSVIVQEDGKVLCASADVDKYLTVGTGNFQNNIIKMARGGLRVGLRATLQEAKTRRRRVVHDDLSLRIDGNLQRVMLYEMFGYTEETFVPTKAGFLDVVHPDDRPELERLIASAFTQTCEHHECEFRVVRGDNGEIVWTHCRGNIRRSDGGSPLSILSVAVDVTGRKQREISLAFLADLDGQLAALTTAEAIITVASQCVAEFLQLSHFLMIEMDENAERAHVILDYCTDQSRSLVGVHDMSAFATQEERRQLSAGLPMIVNDTTAETRLPTFVKNFAALQVGAILNAPSSRDKRLEFMLSVTKRHPHVWREDEIDFIRQLSNTLRLKLERAHAESALRNSEERFRDLADNISQLAWMADPTGSITWYNQRWFDYTGTTLDEMKDWGWKSVQHPDHLDRVVSSWTRSLRSGDVWEETFPLRSKQGEYRWYLSLARPIRDESGNILRWFGTNTDITDAKHASEQLQASQERLRLGIEVAEFALAEIDYATNTVNLSCEAARLYGLGDGEMQVTRERIQQTFHPDDRDMIQQLIDECLDDEDTGCEMAIEHRIVLPSGDVRWLSVRKRGFFDRSQKLPHPKHGILAARDITERKQWEIELADRESHLRRVINNQLGLVGVIDKYGILLEVDDRSLAIAQTRREEVVGKHFADAPWWNYDPAVAQKMHDAMQRALAGEVVRYDVSLFAHGDAGVLIDFMIAPVKNEAGEIEYLIPSGVDIRERAAYEQSLKETLRRMEMALRAGRMAAWEWTAEKCIWTDRVYELLGIDSSQEASIEQFFSLVHPEDIESFKSEWQKAVDEADAYQAEFRIIRPDAEIRWIKGMGEVVRNKARKVVRMYGVNWDVTLEHEQASALRLSEQMAQAANQSKSEFLANMSHEIRTPMTAILGYTDLISEKLHDTEAMEYVRTIRRNGDFLLDIINDILDLSKIEAGKFEVSQQSFSPQWLVEDVRSIMEVRATENKIKLQVEYRGAIPDQIESDPKRLRQILINLVGNAIKFTPEGSVRIVVSYSETTRKLRFDVVDSGIGISDRQLRRLFQPFSQGDGNVNREFGGTGLGLVISKRLTEMLGGEISVESELGKGSTFTVTIDAGNKTYMALVEPISQTHDHPPEPNPSDIRLSCHILVVDDRRDIRFLSKRLLMAAGATVDEAEDGELAVARVSEAIEQGERYDLILLDMQMPKLDGYATAKALRELGFAEPIIALTADAMQGDMKRCIESGCNDYLSKPIDKTLLLNLVNRLTS